MGFVRWLQISLVAVACLGLLVPAHVVQAAESAPPQPDAPIPLATAVSDVSLNAAGLLTGRLVDRQGRAISSSVTVLHNDKIVSQVKTDALGNFRVVGLNGGTYRLMADQGVAVCRVWAAGTAPPGATQSVLIVADGRIAAGQFGLRYWLSNHWVIAGLVTAAVAAPIIAHNNRLDPDRKGS
jgi:hypothetical protein